MTDAPNAGGGSISKLVGRASSRADIRQTVLAAREDARPTKLSQAVPPKIKNAAPPSLAIFTGVIFGTAIAGALAVLFFFDPAKNNFFPTCTFHKLTGLYCPGCGATRALYALLHGNFSVALKDNALFIFTLAVLAARGAWFAAKHFLQKRAGQFFPPVILWAFVIVAAVFTVLRNFPAFAWLSP